MNEITAPRNFSPGEVVFKGKPFIEILSRGFKDVACGSCYERALNLKSCKVCLNVRYCDKSCQKKDWKNHKLECQNLRNLPSEDIEKADLTHLLGNTILKIKGKDWKTIKCNIFGREASFEEMDSNLEDISATYRHMFCNSIKEYTRRYIGNENMPNDEDFMKIFGKVYNSKFRTVIPETGIIIVGLIWFLVKQTKCIPNCSFIQESDGYRIKAIKKIEKSEKLFLSNNSLYSVENITPYAPCSCTECRLPYGESVLTKVMDEQKALGAITDTQQFINTWHVFPEVQSMPEMKYAVDDLLQKHEGVLGKTNILHLKLLTIKCFGIESHPLERKRNLLKLEKHVVATFGEYYLGLINVYKALFITSVSIGNIFEATIYLEKIKVLLN